MILIGVAAFCTAFLGCLQAINVVRGHRWMAAFTSLAIGTCQLTLYKLVPHVDSFVQGALFVLAGLAGSQGSMVFKAWHDLRAYSKIDSMNDPITRPEPPLVALRTSQDLDTLLQTLSKFGEPSLRKMDGGWYCGIDMHVSTLGTKLEVRSEFGLTDPLTAVRQCADRVIALVTQMARTAS